MSRGPRRFGFTYDDIAKAVGWTREQVMRTKRAGAFDPTDLRSLSLWVLDAMDGEVFPCAPRYGRRARR